MMIGTAKMMKTSFNICGNRSSTKKSPKPIAANNAKISVQIISRPIQRRNRIFQRKNAVMELSKTNIMNISKPKSIGIW